jgi:hypothetical protein
MVASTRLKGAKLTLKLGTPAVDYYADVTSWLITSEDADKDVITFADVADGGGRQYLLNTSAVQSTDTASFWTMTWEKTGTDVAFTVAPHGNAAPTPAQPHFSGIVTIGNRPDIGGEAGASNTFTFDSSWKIVGTPTKITA